ncbi:SRPBCC family protein [Streptomyces sp. UH6]|uniref:SRPBCC family protein n=1 Tax=Streptomyces sp. UH6 TaxID=2748379 RepID=UPI0015D4F9E3|nr:SRPBCC family protein [Streptomyces sp. UH6]NYV78864.1 SRPBCC family protein [Streptomyces sp. UH6]
MAQRHRLIKATPEEVWGILADGERYADWVVGTARSRPVRGDWPEVGAAITYEIRLGPLRLHNETVVRRCLPGRELELEAKAGPLGTARIALELRSWGDDTLIIVDEHPLQGAGGKIHNVAVEALIQLRHREMLRRLEEVCEEACRRDGGRPGPSDQGRVRPAGA